MARKISVEIIGDSRSLERAFGRASKSGSKFGKTMSGIGKAAAAGMGAGLLAAGFALKRGFSELAESQKVAAQTRAVLKSTGNAAGVTAKQVNTLANRLSKMSGVDDEAIAGMENILLTFTSIKNVKGNKIFDQATAATLDMSTALGMDLNSAAIMVGKALNQMDVTAQGNVRGFMALRRVGVQVTPEMMDMAKSFIEAGKPMEAQKLLLRELQTEFGGSARAYGTTLPGAMGRLRNAFDEVAAAFAKGFLPLINKVAKNLTQRLADPAFVARVERLGNLIGEKLYNAFVSISQWFRENWPGIRQGFQNVANVARKVFDWVSKIAGVTPGGAATLIGLMAAGILTSKVIALNKALLTTLRRLRLIGTAGGGGVVGGKGKGKGGGKGLPFGFSGPLAVAAAVVASGGGGTQRGDRSALYPLTYAAVRAAAKGNLGPRALAIIKDALDNHSLANAPDKKMREAESRLRKLYSGTRPNQHVDRRARGGPVMPGVPYLVGERGPELFVPGSSGNIVPNGGRGGGDVVINLDGREIARVALGHIQRSGKRSASQQRGRLGGQNLALS